MRHSKKKVPNPETVLHVCPRVVCSIFSRAKRAEIQQNVKHVHSDLLGPPFGSDAFATDVSLQKGANAQHMSRTIALMLDCSFLSGEQGAENPQTFKFACLLVRPLFWE